MYLLRSLGYYAHQSRIFFRGSCNARVVTQPIRYIIHILIYSFFFFRIFLLTCKKLSSNLLVKIISSFSLFYLCIKYTYFPPRIIIYYSHVKIYPILEKHFWLLLSLLPIMIHKELLKKKKKNHTNFRSKTKKMPHTHGIYLGFLLYYVLLHSLAPTIIIESFWTKK